MKQSIEEEKSKMQLLAGIDKDFYQPLEESLLSRVAGILGITLASLGSAIAQSPQDYQTLSKGGYDKTTIQALQHAMTDSSVVRKLNTLGVKDDNIQKAVDLAEKGYKATGVSHKTVHSEEELKKLLGMGYHLTFAQVDTIVDTIKGVAPMTQVVKIPLTFGDGAFFQSGRFTLTQDTKDSIMSVLNTIQANGDILLHVTIESSTDKQPLTPNLQKTLKSLGYKPDNSGLSLARNNTINDFVTSQGIDTSIITQDIKYEQGTGIIDQSARYVKASFDVLMPRDKFMPGTPDTLNKELVPTYNLVKTYVYKKIKMHPYSNPACTTNVGDLGADNVAVCGKIN